MDEPSSDTSPEQVFDLLRPCVRFFPGLSDQRQIFLLDILRKYNPSSVLDIGCGEGVLLEAVSRPSFALPITQDFDIRRGINADAPRKCPEDIYGSLNVSRIAGLDICGELLKGLSETIEGMDGMISAILVFVLL